MSARYAVYLAPAPESALWRFGSRVLGRDAVTGETVEGFAPDGFSPEAWRDCVREPRRYGFHATLKAPFRLKPGVSATELHDGLAALAASTPAFDLGPLQMSGVALGSASFVALTPLQIPSALIELEARVVRDLDRFRAPLTPEEWSRRRPDRLTPRQRALLAEFGYPYVLQEFRPHFTLSGAVESARALAESLASEFRRSQAEPDFRVDALALFVQQNDEPFLVTRRFPLMTGARP